MEGASASLVSSHALRVSNIKINPMAARQRLGSYILPPALALGLVLLLRLCLFSVVRVRSSALSPQITPGAVAFVFHRAELRAGRPVLFRLPAEHETEWLALGRIRRISSDSLGAQSYWILADDTLQHPDSRDLGWVAETKIVGAVIYHLNF